MDTMKSSQKVPREVQSRAVRLVEEHREEYPSLAAALQSIAPKIGCTPKTLRVWVNQAAVEAGSRPGMPASERQRIQELEREVKALRRANEILKLASAFFAQAELDRRCKR
ncbi:Mobile element protein [Acidithiobacillus caldus ATCC 51756]|jgi:transposase-like protein|nr:Mobile element protein [Acidithiobacillus caldus ATCC 51756]QER46063.1 transposase IS3/IS911 family protein [Acidithiobacillus caldus]